jgi:hypothetical protein
MLFRPDKTTQWNIRPKLTVITSSFSDSDIMEHDEERVLVSQREMNHIPFPHILDPVINESLPSVIHQNPVEQSEVLPAPISRSVDQQSSTHSHFSKRKRDEKSLNVEDIVEFLNGILSPSDDILREELILLILRY